MHAEITKLLAPAAPFWAFPFRYESEGSRIIDANGDMILDVRGWGHLTGAGGHNIDINEASRVQDHVGCAVANLLNSSWPVPVGTGFAPQHP